MSEQKNDYKTQNIRFGIGNKQIIANNTYDNCVVFCVEGKDYKTNKLTEKQIDELFDKGLLKRFCEGIADKVEDKLSSNEELACLLKDAVNDAIENKGKSLQDSLDYYAKNVIDRLDDIKDTLEGLQETTEKGFKRNDDAHDCQVKALQEQNKKLDSIAADLATLMKVLQEELPKTQDPKLRYNEKENIASYDNQPLEIDIDDNDVTIDGDICYSNIEVKAGGRTTTVLNPRGIGQQQLKLLEQIILLMLIRKVASGEKIDWGRAFAQEAFNMIDLINNIWTPEHESYEDFLLRYMEAVTSQPKNQSGPQTACTLAEELSEKYGIKIEKAEKDEDGNISLVIKGEEVNSEAFVNVHDIKEIEFRKVKRISNGAISRCMALKTVKFPSATNDIGECAIAECDALEELTVARNNTKYRSVNNCVIDIKAHQLVLGCKSSVIPDDGSVLSIRAFAFSGYNGLDIKIPACIETIQDFAFYNCYGTITCDVALQPEGWGKEWQSGEAKVEWQEEQYNQDPYEEEPDYGEDVDDEEEDPTPTETFDNGCKDEKHRLFAGLDSILDWKRFPETFDNVCKDEKYRLFVGFDSILDGLSFGIMLMACEWVITAMIIGTSLSSLIGACIAVFGMIVWVLLNSFSRWGRELGKERFKVIQKRYKGFLCISAITFVVLMLVSAVLPTANIPIWVFVYLLPCVGAVVMLIVAIITLEKFKANRAYSVNAVVSVLILVLSCCTFIGQAKVGGWLNWNDSVTHYGANAYFDDGLYLQRKDGQLIIVGTSDNLTNVTIPDGVTSIDDSTFRGCSDLTSIVVEDGNPVYHSAGNCLIETATKTLILGCKTSIIPDDGSVTSIGDYAFYKRSGLTSVTIPDSVTSIGDLAFSGCSGLTNVTVGSGVTSIGDWAFDGCSGLTSVTIPDSVTSISDWAFDGCTGLTSIVVEDGNPVYHSAGNCIIKTDSKTLILGCKTSVIPDDGSVTSIGYNAFYGCSGLTSITIPDSVTSIGSSAFSGCSSLQEIIVAEGNPVYHSAGNCIIETESKTLIAGCKSSVIPNDGSVTSIGSSAFSGCTGLTSITIPDSVTSIGSSAFFGCTGLTSVTIPDSVTSIDDSAFSGCSDLTSIVVEDGNPVYHSAGNCLIETATKTLILGCKTSVILDDGSVTSIGDLAFSGCSGLTSVTIPDSVTSIGSRAFSGCTGLTSITIPDSVTSIGDWAFSGCSSDIADIEDDIIYVDGWVIDCDTSVTKAKLRDTTKGIAGSAFYGYSGLTSITIPDSVISIGDYAFYNCSGLTSITIPDSVISIGEDAFYGCSGLKSITIPDSVTSIGDWAFYGCTGLTSITIPDSVTSIGEFAFYDCSDLTTINFQGTKAQWQAIEKDSSWDLVTGDYTVHCTDGTISKADA